MASKTVIKLLLAKYAPLTTDMQRAQLADQSVIKGEDDYEYVDNTPELPETVAKDKEKTRLIEHINGSETIKELGECFDFLTDEETKKVYADKLEQLKIKE
jgi:recombination protein RecT